MKIDYISDLHNDFWIREINVQKTKFRKKLEEHVVNIGITNTKSDMLIIPGDLGHYNQQDQQFLIECKKYYKYIMIVRGNHDMYLVSNSSVKKYCKNSKNRYLEMKRWCESNDIFYLDGNVISIDGYNFGGVGMSWDKTYYNKLRDYEAKDSEVFEHFKNTMNDAKLIYDGGDNYKVSTAYGGSYLHTTFKPFDYFESEYNKLQRINDFDNIDVMVSHYIPTSPYDYGNSVYKNDLSSTFYMFNGEKDIERIQPKYWLFGHMHDEYDFLYKDVNFLCNPLGYPGEKTFGKVKTIEL